MKRHIALLAILPSVALAQGTIDATLPALPPAYNVQPAPPQWWAPCGAVAAPLPASCTAADGTIVDLRGETINLLYSANPDLHGGACNYTGSQARPVQRYPFGNPSDVNPALGIPNAVFWGGRVIGNISLTLDGFVNASNGGYCNSTALDLKNIASTHQTVRQIRIDGVWDAIRFGQEPCKTSGGCNHVIENVWVSNVRDDAIEYDLGYSGLTIRDSLFDGVFSFVSMAPSGTVINHSTDTVKVERTLVRMHGWPYGQLQLDGTRPVLPYHIAPFKTGGSADTAPERAFLPKWEIRDSVFGAVMYNPNNSTASTDTGSHWAYFARQIDPARCSGNVFLWMADTPLPALMIAELPPCFTVLVGADARWYWDYRKAQWIEAHTAVAGVPPGLENLPGMPKHVERVPGDPQ